ncbi:MAG: HIT family protein [Planctomycetota bacterium]
MMRMQNLWAPWRMQYLENLTEETKSVESDVAASKVGSAPAGSFLADYWRHPEKDAEHHVVYRNEHGMLLLNLYPYANGHLMVALGDPRPRLMDYTPEQRTALWSLVDLASDLAEQAFNPQGLNIGINQGKAAGAGVPQHLHVHIVPRWGGDTNFITVVGQVRVVPDALQRVYRRYCDTLPAVLKRHESM